MPAAGAPADHRIGVRLRQHGAGQLAGATADRAEQRLDDAREIVARLRVVTPVVIPDLSFLRNAEHRELFLSGLRLAAGEAA